MNRQEPSSALGGPEKRFRAEDEDRGKGTISGRSWASKSCILKLEKLRALALWPERVFPTSTFFLVFRT